MSSPPEPTTIVADQDPLARRMIADTLRQAGLPVLAEARTGLEAIELAREHRPELVVLTEADGPEVTRRLLAEHPTVRVVVLAAVYDEERGLQALHAGAAGYLSKEIGLEHALPRALRGACRGEAAISRRLASLLIDRLRTAPVGGAGLRPVRCRLTDREWEVLDLLASGLPPAEIADGLVLSTETVRSHVKSVYRKLEVNSREGALHAARQLRHTAGLAAA